MNGIIADYDQAIQTEQVKIDAGNAQSLLDAIVTLPPGQEKNELLAASPYLSDKVLIAYLDKKNTAPPGHVQQVILANSPIGQNVLYSLLQRNLPNGIMNQINAAQTGVSEREELVRDIAFLESRRENTVNELIRTYLNDENLTRTEALNNVANIFKSEGRHGRKSKAIPCYIQQKEFVEAEQMLATAHPDGNYDDFCRLMAVELELAQQPEREKALATDAVKEAEVRTLAEPVAVKTQFKARTMLKVAFNEHRPEKLVIPGQNNKMAPQDYMGQSSTSKDEIMWLEETHTLVNFPDPFSHYTTIEAFVPEGVGNPEIVIYNLLGIAVKKYTLLRGYNIVTVMRDDLGSEGLYIYALKGDGKIIDRDNMILLK